MDPVIGVSVARISPSCWVLGSLMVCEKLDSESKPADVTAHWKDGDDTFYLRKRSADDSELSAGDSEAGQDTFVKVHS
jgi:hypothetical protein